MSGGRAVENTARKEMVIAKGIVLQMRL